MALICRIKIAELYFNPANGARIFLSRNSDGKEVVVKEVERSADTALSSMVAEGDLPKSLDHVNICKVYSWEIVSRDGSCFLRIEMEKGDSDLGYELSKRSHAWTEEEIWNMLSQTVSGFRYAQKRNVCHRDVKPHNILIKSNGQVLISDFGTAKLVTMSGLNQHTLQGTPNYLSPELFLFYTKLINGEQGGRPVYDPYRSDVYSLGLSFIEMIRLRFPGEMRNPLHIANTTERILANLNCSEDLKVLLSAMVEPEAEYRPDFLQLAKMIGVIRNCKLKFVAPMESNYSKSIRRTISLAPNAPSISTTLQSRCHLCRCLLELEHISLECNHQFCMSVGCLEAISQGNCPVCNRACCITLQEICIECRKRSATWHHSVCGRGYCKNCASSWRQLPHTPKCISCRQPLVLEEQLTRS